jgi:hypothetical protein
LIISLVVIVACGAVPEKQLVIFIKKFPGEAAGGPIK